MAGKHPQLTPRGPSSRCHVRLRFTDFFHPAHSVPSIKAFELFFWSKLRGRFFLLSHLLGPVLADPHPKKKLMEQIEDVFPIEMGMFQRSSC